MNWWLTRIETLLNNVRRSLQDCNTTLEELSGFLQSETLHSANMLENVWKWFNGMLTKKDKNRILDQSERQKRCLDLGMRNLTTYFTVCPSVKPSDLLAREAEASSNERAATA